MISRTPQTFLSTFFQISLNKSTRYTELPKTDGQTDVKCAYNWTQTGHQTGHTDVQFVRRGHERKYKLDMKLDTEVSNLVSNFIQTGHARVQFHVQFVSSFGQKGHQTGHQFWEILRIELNIFNIPRTNVWKTVPL